MHRGVEVLVDRCKAFAQNFAIIQLPNTVIQPDMNDGDRWMRQMRNGEFAAAWQISDRIFSKPSRWRSPRIPRHQQLVWNREPLADKAVLVRCYHGLGDTIQFIRYVPLLKKIAKRVIVWAQPTLLSLLSRIEGIDELLPLHDGNPDCMYEIDVEIMELPYVFRTVMATIPSRVPYIQVTPAPLDPHPLKVGLVWRAGDWDRRRNLPFSFIKSVAGVHGVDFYALQQNAPIREYQPDLRFIAPSTADVLSTARIVAGLDLVISIDSMPAHLAGAMGIPTWTLLHKHADWRWLRDRKDSPWYPAMRLFRQRRAGDWKPVIDAVTRELSELASKTAGALANRSNGAKPSNANLPRADRSARTVRPIDQVPARRSAWPR